MKITIKADRKHAKQVRHWAQRQADNHQRLDGVIKHHVDRLDAARSAFAPRQTADDYSITPNEWILLRDAMDWSGCATRHHDKPIYAVGLFLGANVCLSDGKTEPPKLSVDETFAHALQRFHETESGFLVLTEKEWVRLRNVCIARGWRCLPTEHPQPRYVVGKFMGALVVVR